jgi:hypothetical protein
VAVFQAAPFRQVESRAHRPAGNSPCLKIPLPTAPKIFPTRQAAAIDAMVSGECRKISEAAEKVGLARESLSRALSKPHIAALMREKVLRSLAIAATRAGATKVELLDSDNAMVRDRASTFVLGLAGIQPATSPSVNVNIEMKAGYVIDLREPGEGPEMRIVSSTGPAAIDHNADPDNSP